MMTAAKAALTNSSLTVRIGCSPCELFDHLCQEVINALQKPPGLLVPCCVVPAADIRMVKVLHEDQDL